MDAGRLADQLVEGRVDEVGELDLGDGAAPGQGQPDGHTDDARLGERHVEHPGLAELAAQPVGGPEHAAPRTDVLTQHHDPFVVGHQLVQRVPHRVDDVLLDAARNTGRRLDDPKLGPVARAGRHTRDRSQRPGEHPREGLLTGGGRSGLGPPGGVVDLGLDLGLEVLLGLLGQQPLLDDVLLHALQRVLLAPGLDFLGRAVGAVVVVGRVGQIAIRLALDERGPLAVAGPGHGRVGGRVHVEGIVAVDDDAGEPVGVGVLGDVLDGRLLGQGHGDGVAVVLADEDHGDAVNAGEVQRLVEVAFGRRPVAEVGDGHARVVARHLRGQGHARGVGDVGGDRRRTGDDVQRPAAPVAGHLAPARAGVGGPGEDAEQHVVRRHPECEHHAGVPVVGEHDIVSLADGPRRAHLGTLVALAAHDEGRLAHAVQAPDLLVEPAGQQDGAVHAEQVVVGESQLAVAVVQME